MTTKPARRVRFISLHVKVLVGFTILFTLVFAAIYLWFYQFATNNALDEIKRSLQASLETGAAKLNVDELMALYREGTPRADGFTDDPRYWDIIAWFDTIHHIEPRAWPYTFLKDGNDLVFITDLYAKYNTEKAATFRERCTVNDNCGDLNEYFYPITSGQTWVSVTPSQDKWGTWVSGITPLKDSQGNIVAALGLDFEAQNVYDVQASIRNSLALAFIISYVVLFVLIYIASGTFTRPLAMFNRAAHKIGEGDYNEDLSSLRRGLFYDEIGALSEVFERMVQKVRTREESLKQEVRELRIEIDQAKLKKEVHEIVDTEFFSELQAKAKALRDRQGE